MKHLTTYLAALSLVSLYSAPLAAQEVDCWHYENGDAPIVGSVDTPGSARGVAVAGAYAYVACGSGGGNIFGSMQVIDISVPESPVIVGEVGMTDWTFGGATGVAVTGNFAYVIGGAFGGDENNSLKVVDISVPESPAIVGAVDIWSAPGFVAVAGNYAYVRGYVSYMVWGLQVVDISVPESPVIVGAVDTPGCAQGVAVAGDYAYLVSGSSGLQVIDISVPESPEIVGAVFTAGEAQGVAVAGDYAYVAAGEFSFPVQGLQVIDISVPESPEIVGATYTAGEAQGVAVAGDYAYLAGDSGLQVIDITNPTSPQLVGGVGTGRANGLVVAEPYIYISSLAAGMVIAWQQCDDNVAIEDDPEETTPDDGVPNADVRLTVHPNPFNPRTTISLAIDRPQNVELCVFDMTGKRIAVLADRAFEAGQHSMDWEGRDLKGNAVASGTYLLRMVSDEGVAVEKMMLIR